MVESCDPTYAKKSTSKFNFEVSLMNRIRYTQNCASHFQVDFLGDLRFLGDSDASSNLRDKSLMFQAFF